MGRQSLDVDRVLNQSRHSTDQPRASTDRSYIATDIDLAPNSRWWTEKNLPPPKFQNRPHDILYEIEESSTSKRGGKTTISKDVYALFQDYSQTVINARFDAANIDDVALEQRHEPPPPRLRQDQLEDAWSRIGAKLAAAVESKVGHTVGDGSPQALVTELLKKEFPSSALLPVGTRAYGALVYANIANSSVQQFDEIRAGDVISFRNTKFQGTHGAMHTKYKSEIGRPDHVAVVGEWDGRRKKVRGWEQGRDDGKGGGKRGKVEAEQWKMEDLRSGEVRIWRVVGRGWVGWE